MFNSKDQIQSFTDILEFYEQKFANNKKQKTRLGVEWERMGIREDRKPVQYLDGYELILQNLVKDFDWQIADQEAGHIFTLKRGTTLITTEADGKPEISGSPFDSLNKNAAELQVIANEIDAIAKPLGITWLTNGSHPYADYRQIKLAPKPRYQVFRQYLSDKNPQWIEPYMKEWCGVHLNIDCISSADLIKKTQISLRISPILCGVFANSPMNNGKFTGVMSARRRDVFTIPGFGRHLMMSGVLAKDFSLEEWFKHFWNREMYILMREQESLPVFNGKTFADFFKEGYQGHKPTFIDFDYHIKSFWIDLRPRLGYLEFRPIDSLPLKYLMALSAFYKGLLMHSDAEQAVGELTSAWREEDLILAHKEAWQNGIRAEYKQVNFINVMQQLLPLVEQSLERDELKLLNPLKELLAQKVCPAEIFMQNLETQKPEFRKQ